MQSLMHDLDRLEAFDRRAQVGDRLRPLAGGKLEVEQAAHRAVFHEDRIGEAGERQPARQTQEPIARLDRPVESVDLFLAQEGHEIGLWTRLSRSRSRFTPRQGVSLRISCRERVHHAIDHFLERPAPFQRVRAKPAHRACADAAEARGQSTLECVRVVRPAERFEIADQEPNHLVARGRAPTSDLVGQAERPQRFLERAAQRRRAPEHDRKVTKTQVRPLRAQAFDLASGEERLVDRIALARHHHRGPPV